MREKPLDHRRERLRRARLMLVIESEPPRRSAAEVVASALEGGVDVVQLREKAAPDRVIVQVAAALRRLCDAHGALLLVNDRPDLVAPCRADGVHLGQEDRTVEDARRELGERPLIGISTHSAAEVDRARSSEADYLGVGPVFATPTKPGAAPVGHELVRHAAGHAGKPFFAIGGIDTGNAASVAAAGAPAIAVIRAIRDAADPRAAAAALYAAVAEKARGGATA